VIEIVTAPPYLTVQDAGRLGHRASGVPVSGAMDSVAMAHTNSMVGNVPGAATLEWALGGGVIRFTDRHRFALGGAGAEATLDGKPIGTDRPYDAAAGAVLAVRRFTAGRFLYVAIAGGIDVPVVLGSRSTYLPARLGGHHGRRLASGDRLPIGAIPRDTARDSAAPATPRPSLTSHRGGRAPLRVIRGPDVNRFTADGWRTFVSEPFRVSIASDRTGYRLDGPVIERMGADDGLSTPVCPGVVQVPPLGRPLVLMADAPTIGGYPMLAVVSSADLSRLAQCKPGDIIRFSEIPVDTANR
jgi:antagonist of KipI